MTDSMPVPSVSEVEPINNVKAVTRQTGVAVAATLRAWSVVTVFSCRFGLPVVTGSTRRVTLPPSSGCGSRSRRA